MKQGADLLNMGQGGPAIYLSWDATASWDRLRHDLKTRVLLELQRPDRSRMHRTYSGTWMLAVDSYRVLFESTEKDVTIVGVLTPREYEAGGKW